MSSDSAQESHVRVPPPAPVPPLPGTSPRTGANLPSSELRGDFVYTQLRADIHSGRLKPGERLREAEIAKRLRVSRTPVREAIKRLELEGLAMYALPRGLTVAELTHSQILELYAMREVLEAAASRLAAQHASPLEVTSLKQILAEQERAVTADEAAAANRRLHDGIVAAAHNVYLERAMNVLSDATALLGGTTYTYPGRIEAGYAENAEIIDYIAKHDPMGAERAAQHHIRAISTVRIAMARGRR